MRRLGSGLMWELEERVPDRLRAFWMRVVALNRLTHHQEVEFPMGLNRASCDWTFRTFVSMLNELWEWSPAEPAVGGR